MNDFLEHLFGANSPADTLSWGQMAARTVLVFFFGVVLVRLADRRFLGRNAGFDVMLAIVLGSVLSRGINGQAPFFKTLGVSALLVLLHRLLAAAACRWSALSRFVKGRAVVLVKNGQPQRAALRAADISGDDLEENLRLNGNISNLAEVAEARLERNGQISVLKRSDAA